MSYNVVHRTIKECTHTGVITWTSYESKECYDKWNNAKMKSWYETVAEGVTREEAIAMCSTPEASNAVILAHAREISELFEAP